MEPMLMVIGLNYRSAPVEIRERFWISETGRYDAVLELAQSEGIEELVVLATCNRTEFILWASDADLAAGSVLHFLTAHYRLTLEDWKHFYRLLDSAALLHIFRVACSLDSMVVGEPQIIAQVKNAWQQAQKIGSTAHFLDAVMQKALTVSKRVRNETAIGNSAVSIPSAAVELARQVLGTLEGKKVLLLGAGKMSELSARYLVGSGASGIRVINRTYENAVELARTLGGEAVRFEDRWQSFVDADIVISSTSCPHTILSREEAEIITRMREQRPWVLVDIALPRDIDPKVRGLEGVFLYDLDSLEKVVQHNAGERELAAVEAESIVAAEAKEFRGKLLAQRLVPTIVALRGRLDEICRQELESFRQECGPFPKDQEQLYAAVASRITQRIAGSLARELKGFPEQTEQEQMTAAVQRLFHLEPPQTAAAGTRH